MRNGATMVPAGVIGVALADVIGAAATTTGRGITTAVLIAAIGVASAAAIGVAAIGERVGALAGAQTVTAAMAAVQERSGSPVAVLGYTPAYPIGNILLTTCGTIIVVVMAS